MGKKRSTALVHVLSRAKGRELESRSPHRKLDSKITVLAMVTVNHKQSKKTLERPKTKIRK